MLGYVKKSKVTTANTTAKSLYNAVNTSLVDLDTEDVDIKAFNGVQTSLSTSLLNKVYNYFSDLKAFSAKSQNGYAVKIDNGQCTGVGIINGKYAGSYPRQMTIDANDSNNSTATAALSYGISGM